MSKESLLKQIDNYDAKICVIGLGHVGLPTALTFSKAGFNVIGHDINNNLLKIINSKKSPFKEVGLEELLRTCLENNKFTTSNNLQDCISSADIVIICVATPITKESKPNLSELQEVCKQMSTFSLENKLIIIESSIPPFTFEKLVLSIFHKDLKTGFDFWIAYAPERLSPGNALSEIKTTSRVIGQQDQNAGTLAKSLYKKIISSEIVLTSPIIAETSKLVENTFRDVSIAFANEIALLCEKYGIDVSELIKICNSHPRVNIIKPGPGVGGPCLPKDPYLLLNPQGLAPITSALISNSRKTNDGMPLHVVNIVEKALKNNKLKISKSTVLILGTSYKANVSETRFSPAKKIISELITKGVKVLVFDPHTDESFGGEKISNVWEGISSSDALLLVTDHTEFKKLDLVKISNIMKPSILIDTRRIFDRKQAEQIGIHYFSVGYSKNYEIT